jgi:coenzyme F420-reducing hydrogenase delta subunit
MQNPLSGGLVKLLETFSVQISRLCAADDAAKFREQFQVIVAQIRIQCAQRTSIEMIRIRPLMFAPVLGA